MKRVVLSLALLAILACPVFSAASEIERTITVRADAAVEAAPDTAVVTLAVETTGKSAKSSAAENAKITDEVFKAVRSSAAPGDSVETSSFSVFPVYDYEKGGGQILRGFRTVHQVRVVVSRPSSAGEIIDKAMASGANRVVEARFDILDITAQCDVLIRTAAARARAQALSAAAAFGAGLDGVKSIVPSCAREGEARPRSFRVEAMVNPAATHMEPGTVRLRSDVEAVYFLVDGK